jgi:hypothetical protein
MTTAVMIDNVIMDEDGITTMVTTTAQNETDGYQFPTRSQPQPKKQIQMNKWEDMLLTFRTAGIDPYTCAQSVIGDSDLSRPLNVTAG